MSKTKFNEERKHQKPTNVETVERMKKYQSEPREWVECQICGDLCPKDIYGYEDAHVTCTYTEAGKRYLRNKKSEKKRVMTEQVRPSMF